MRHELAMVLSLALALAAGSRAPARGGCDYWAHHGGPWPLGQIVPTPRRVQYEAERVLPVFQGGRTFRRLGGNGVR